MNTPSRTAPDTVHPSEFRRAMRNVPTTVTVVGTMNGDQPVGMVVGTFTAISMDPLLVGFFGDQRSKTLTEITAADRWSFSILHQDDGLVAEAFRGPAESRFSALDWDVSDFGTPLIRGAVITIEAIKDSVVRIGDHDLVTAEVTSLREGDRSRYPLVYFQGGMTRLDPEHASHSGDTIPAGSPR
ncbi:flavin reductase (DIM6/NTAB) family NADH-FMN oxidoreductase RutF [Prauserella sediminis]|uniref:Flavin reductase (DIM6/NTAB) family NADH-FMN oxidoreductase RutF n=1 Tax=Prauserella sediminis TaxID=577680 RepID=A0A839XU25_9PSEU|nr:flavin reductase family protein [Prauserella sediminis]MBB3664538.1 flavin reductase (DIM6/NTAB) family NADH-FMN oxidoreductase RutF [Prauserella sediminis]